MGEEWGSRSLAGDFIVPPFDVLNAQRGEWQKRKRSWVSILGLQTEDLGRETGLIAGAPETNPVRQVGFYRQKAEWEKANGRAISTSEFKHLYVPHENIRIRDTTSRFDPALAEVCITWYSAEGWLVFDPFGGGVERGLVASYLRRPYIGVELRQEQVDANKRIAELANLPIDPLWICDDAMNSREVMRGRGQAGFVLTCPPYWDLEVYSDRENDVSNMTLNGFLTAMDAIVAATLDVLKPDRFAVMVMGDKRYGSRKQLAHLPHRMIESFESHGALLHNDIAMLTSLGSKPQIARYAFERRRTLQPLHEHVLVFCKGDAKKAVLAMGEVEISEGSDFIKSGGQLSFGW